MYARPPATMWTAATEEGLAVQKSVRCRHDERTFPGTSFDTQLTERHTNRNVGKRATRMRSPDVFWVRIPNNGRVLAAAISHQVFHVASPGHVCEIATTRLKWTLEESESPLERQKETAKRVTFRLLMGLQQSRPCPTRSRPGFLLV